MKDFDKQFNAKEVDLRVKKCAKELDIQEIS